MLYKELQSCYWKHGFDLFSGPKLELKVCIVYSIYLNTKPFSNNKITAYLFNSIYYPIGTPTRKRKEKKPYLSLKCIFKKNEIFFLGALRFYF